MSESKIEATHRLQAAGLWVEASRYREEVRQRLRDEGRSRADAKEEAWRAMLEKYPPTQIGTHEPCSDQHHAGIVISDHTEQEFDAIVAELPERAPISTEQAWIKSHPAMRRGNRNRDKMRDIVLTVEDIEGAPSQWAVNQLQHWCNKTTEYFKTCLAEDRKAMAEEGNSLLKDETPADWAEIQRMHDTMKTARKRLSDAKSESQVVRHDP